MGSLQSVLFYAFAAVTVAGGLAAVLLDGRAREYGLPAAVAGAAALMADLSAWAPAAATLVAGGLAAWLLRGARRVPEAPSQPAGALAGVAFLALCYVAFRGSYAGAAHAGGLVVPVFFVGAFLVAAGLYLAGRRDSFAAALAGVPLLAAGAALDLAVATETGFQAFAVIVAAAGLAFVASGRWLATLEAAR